MSNNTNYIYINNDGTNYYDQLSERLGNLTATDITETLSINKADIKSIEINVDSDVTISTAQKYTDGAFYGCSNLVTVSIVNGSNNINIGAYAFSHCESLSNDTINSLINNIAIINDFSFENCNELVKLDIPARITKIGSYAFSNCANLVKVKLNCDYDDTNIDKINYIGINAFAECVKLAILDLSEGFTTDEAINSILPRTNTSGYSGLVIAEDTVYTSNPKSFLSYPILYAPFAQSIREVVYDVLSGYTLALTTYLPLAGCDKDIVESQMTGNIIFNNDPSLVGIGIDKTNKNNLTLTYYDTDDNTNRTVNFSNTVIDNNNNNMFNITVNGTSPSTASETLSISTNNTLSWSGHTLLLGDNTFYKTVIMGVGHTDGTYLRLQGGNDDGEKPHGAQLRLGGSKYDNNASPVKHGKFALCTANETDGSIGPMLVGGPDGNLTWDGHKLMLKGTDGNENSNCTSIGVGDTDEAWLRLQGGNDTGTKPNGAQLRLGGSNYKTGSTPRGGFWLTTAKPADGSFGFTLEGRPDGKLRWGETLNKPNLEINTWKAPIEDGGHSVTYISNQSDPDNTNNTALALYNKNYAKSGSVRIYGDGYTLGDSNAGGGSVRLVTSNKGNIGGGKYEGPSLNCYPDGRLLWLTPTVGPYDGHRHIYRTPEYVNILDVYNTWNIDQINNHDGYRDRIKNAGTNKIAIDGKAYFHSQCHFNWAQNDYNSLPKTKLADGIYSFVLKEDFTNFEELMFLISNDSGDGLVEYKISVALYRTLADSNYPRSMDINGARNRYCAIFPKFSKGNYKRIGVKQDENSLCLGIYGIRYH